MEISSSAKGEDILRSLRLSAKYDGFLPAAEAIDQCVGHEEYLHPSSAQLYASLAEKHHTSVGNLRKAIGTLCAKIWENPDSRARLTVYNQNIELNSRPKPDELLMILSTYLHRLRGGKG